MDVVDAIDRWPILVDAEGAGGKTCRFPRIRPVPRANQILNRMRRVFERIVFTVDAALFDIPRLLPDRKHGGTEPVELGLGLGFCRFDHQRTWNRPAHGWRVEAAVDEPFGNIVNRNAGALEQRACVDDALVSHSPAAALVKDWVGAFEPLGDIVGVENGDAGCLRQPASAHEQAIAPGDRKNGRRTKRRGRYRDLAPVRFGMARQKRDQMGFDSDRAHARPAAAVRDAKRLVQIEVTDVGAEIAGPRQADKRVEIGAVEIDLAAVRVRDLAQFDDAFLEHAVRRWVGDHARGKPSGVRFGLGTEVRNVDVAARVGADDDDSHAAHLRRRRIGAVRRRRNETHVAVYVAAAAVIGADGEQSGVFALGARVRLHRDRIVSGNLAQLLR